MVEHKLNDIHYNKTVTHNEQIYVCKFHRIMNLIALCLKKFFCILLRYTKTSLLLLSTYIPQYIHTQSIRSYDNA